MLDDFMVRAALAGVGMMLAAGPLGCFVVWRRMAYFGDATAHAAVLGVALALAFDVSVFWGVLATALLMAGTVSSLSGRGFGADTLLGVAAHSALALGLVAVSLLAGARVDLMGYLFGDILSVTTRDLALIWAGGVAVAGLMAWRWQRLLTATLDGDLAFASGVDPKRERLFLTLALALVVAAAIKVVGALLIGAMLLIPPATARAFARTPEAMALGAGALGAAAVVAGLAGSYWQDTPAGPSIVVAAAAGFLLAAVWSSLRKD
ncbi:MAG: metal ABC transporter permease [Alphaproteobacteria bacterium]